MEKNDSKKLGTGILIMSKKNEPRLNFIKITVLVMLMFAPFITQAQTVYFQDNFDSYTAGQKLVGQAPSSPWRTWTIGSVNENPLVTDEQSETPSNSVKIHGVSSTNANDLYFPFAEQPTTGKYSIEFDMYIPSTGKGGYFNVQHWNEPGEEWACEIYFRNNGTGYMVAGSTTQTAFNYGSADSWFHVYMEIDLNEDLATLKVNETIVRSWPFHYQAGETNGIKQLGGVNLYAGTPVGTSQFGTYYFDNFKVLTLSESNEGKFVVEPTDDMDLEIDINGAITKTFTVSNPGGNPVQFRVVPTYLPEQPNTATGSPVEITYCANQDSYGVGWFINTTDFTFVMGLPSSTLENHIGKKLTKFNMALVQGEKAITAEVVVYKMKYEYNYRPAGELVYQQTFTPESTGGGTGYLVNEVTLDTPVLIDGGDMWIGIHITMPEAESVPTGQTPSNIPLLLLDENDTPNINSNYYKTTAAWQQVDTWGNCYMSVEIKGTQKIPLKWITTTPSSGTLAAGQSMNIEVKFGNESPSYLPNTTFVLSTFNGAINFISTDFLNQHVPVNFTTDFILVAPSFVTTTLPDGEIGATYNQRINVTGSSVVTFALKSGDVLPSGLSLSAQGVISGIPLEEGDFTFNVVATNGAGNESQEFTLSIIGDVNISQNLISQIKVYTQNGILNISGLVPGEKLSIYNMSGTLVYENIAQSTNEKINVSTFGSGIYMVKSGKNTIKIAF